jgi:hypothetical protein
VAVLAELIFQDADHPEQAARQVAGRDCQDFRVRTVFITPR